MGLENRFEKTAVFSNRSRDDAQSSQAISPLKSASSVSFMNSLRRPVSHLQQIGATWVVGRYSFSTMSSAQFERFSEA